MRTCVRTLAGVRTLVTLQVALTGKRLGTKLACIGPFASVRAQVDLQKRRKDYLMMQTKDR